MTCRWCVRLATGTVRASGHPARPPTGVIPHCDEHWEDAYTIVRDYPSREWRHIEQPSGLF